ncbi:MAG: HAD family phosphatase [Chloracidobacterium sp.]|nr:HAD family phosphatase [Chloracidobacterium sp.]MDW8217325.1 HAD family phosphatase [Acidobacteriota bacterium]
MVRAIIFDFDGVIADTEDLHFFCLRQTLLEEGININRQLYNEVYLALDDKTCFKQAFIRDGREITVEKLTKLVKRKSQLFYSRLTSIKLFPGIVEWIREASLNFTLAICSGAAKQEIIDILTLYNLLENFMTITSAEDVQNCKPSPEGYLRTLQRLNECLNSRPKLTGAECLVIEDSHAGIEAAKAAGMYCVGVTNSHSQEYLREADIVISCITELSLEHIKAL